MRWDRLFDDLQAQVDADSQHELQLEVSDRTRRERAQVGLHERLIAHKGLGIDLRLRAGFVVSGTVADAGPDWLLVHDRGDSGSLVPFGSIVAINGLGVRAAVGPSLATAKRFDLSEHPADVARRSENIMARRVIPFTAIVVVRHG